MGNKYSLSRPLQAGSEKLRLEYSPHSSTVPSTYGVPMPLDLNCQIFLSHSGKDKEFVRDLYNALCWRYCDNEVAFFDEETLSLRKAVAISMENIVVEAKKSQLGVLVVTEDFFVQTVNPMLELEAFEAERVRLLPLFFGMSVEEFKEKCRTRSWEEVWRKWATKQVGGRSNVKEVMVKWRRSLDFVTTFSGLEYKKIATSHEDYIRRIVDAVTLIIPPLIPLSDEGIFGKDRLCQVVDKMYEKCVAKRSPSIDHRVTEVASTSASSARGEDYSSCTASDLVGIHGFSGLGKTTLCKCLHDSYFSKFNGKICYIDVGSLPADQTASQKHSVSGRLKEVVSRFGIGSNNEFLHFLDIDQVKSLFRRQLSTMKDPVFLAIDNILPDGESQVEADFYLGCEFPKGSRIFITSRSESILTNLVSQHECSFSVVIEYMPALEFEEARDIFVHKFPVLRKFGFLNVEDDVNECVRMCTIHRMVYHPLMVQSLAASIKWDRSIRNVDWKWRLAKVRSEGVIHKENAWDTVFNMFDKAYALLTEEAQRVFLELVLFYNATGYNRNVREWIRIVHPHLRKMKEIIFKLQDLCFLEKERCKKKGCEICFLEKEGCVIKILNLLVEYGKYKARQDVYPEYVVVDDVHCWDDPPRSARTVSISRWGLDMRKRTLDLRDMEGVKVLHIVDNAGLQEVLLSGTTCARLRSLIVRVPEDASLFCIYDGDWSSRAAYPGGCLEWVQLVGDVCFRSLQISDRRVPVSPSNAILGSVRNLEIKSVPFAMDLVSVLGDLWNLEVLKLDDLPSVQNINVSTCANLKVLSLSSMQKLEFINGFENTTLEDVVICSCGVLALTFPAESKTKFSILGCHSLERISFSTMPSYCAGTYSGCIESGLSVIRDCSLITNIDGLSRYTGCFDWWQEYCSLEERVGGLLKLDDGVDFSICKAVISQLLLTGGYDPPGLAGVKAIELLKAQHAGLIMSALFKAQPKDLQLLSICCNRRHNCGCDQNVPHFGPLPTSLRFDKVQRFITARVGFLSYRSVDVVPAFRYNCSQVKDLASLGQWHLLKWLDLRKCTNVEVWPEFAAMTSLETLDLSYTSLKEWPAGVQHLPHLKSFDVRGCRRLPAEELMKVVTFELQPSRPGIVMCIISSLASLRDDLKKGKRVRCSIADALDGVYPELTALFARSSCWSLHEVLVVEIVVAIMYNVWYFGEVDAAQDLGIREKMRGLLGSKSFLSLPFCACRQSLLLPHSSLPQLSTRKERKFVVYRKPLLSQPFRDGGKWELGLKHHARRGVGWMGIALVGGGSVAYFNASLNDIDLRDSILDFFKSFTQMMEEDSQHDTVDSNWMHIPRFISSGREFDMYPLGEKEEDVLVRRIMEAWCWVEEELGIIASSDDDIEAVCFADSTDDEQDSSWSCKYEDLPANILVQMSQ